MKKFFLNHWLKKYAKRTDTFTFRSAGRLAIVPTKFGLALLVVLMAMFIWSANHQINLGYALVFIVGTIFLFSAHSTVNQLKELMVSSHQGEAVFLGETAFFPIKIENKSPLIRYALTIQNDFIPQILPQSAHEHLVGFPTIKRGWQKIDPIEISSGYPFRFFFSWQWIYLNSEVLVYPKPLGDMPLPFHPLSGLGSDSADHSGEDEFTHLRPYYLGDNLSRVSWKHLGRGEYLLKQFGGTGAQQVILRWNDTAGDTEKRLSQLCRWVVDLGDLPQVAYALELPTVQIPLGQGVEHQRRCLEALALYGV